MKDTPDEDLKLQSRRYRSATLLLSVSLLAAALFFWYYPGWIIEGPAKVALFQRLNPFKSHYSIVLLNVKKPDGQYVSLENYRKAVNPAWSELKAFLKEDMTDKKIYAKESYVCSSFSEELHNNAEKAGLKAGFVIIMFRGKPVGHTVNVFDTVDFGRLYVDDTGITPSMKQELKALESRIQGQLKGDGDEGLDPVLRKLMEQFISYNDSRSQYADNIAFLQKDRSYGLLPLDFPGLEFTYPYWERIRKDRDRYQRSLEGYFSELKRASGEFQEFNRSMKAYNDEVRSHNFKQGQFERRRKTLEEDLARLPRRLASSIVRVNPRTGAVERVNRYEPDLQQAALLMAEEKLLRSHYRELMDEGRRLESTQKKLGAWRKKLEQRIDGLKRSGEDLAGQVDRAGVSVFFNTQEEIVEEIIIIW